MKSYGIFQLGGEIQRGIFVASLKITQASGKRKGGKMNLR
jgi:hypothetical protein